MKMLWYWAPLALLAAAGPAQAQLLDGGKQPQFSRADSLRGTLNENRSWWNVLRYDVEIKPDYTTQSLQGKTTITYEVLQQHSTLQIDLQQPLVIDSLVQNGKQLPFERQGNICLVQTEPLSSQVFTRQQPAPQIAIYYHGQPRRAARPPWDGGWIWTQDAKGRPWMSVACQGLGASVWYPCKDHQSDEPEQGASLTITVPNGLVGVGNGRLISKLQQGSLTQYRWEVKNPINNYNLVPYIGHYSAMAETYAGEEGKLDCTYWVLDYEVEKARQQFRQVMPMLHCFEKWFGPYPFYEDGYQLIQAPHLGMEHQSGIAYGNKFLNGYLGRDLSGTGWGNQWDFIIIHESGHEWFGNNMTSNDIADMWIHESFTNYSETIYTECQSGLAAAQEYARGIRRNIQNDVPIIGQYGVNHEGSGDMYAKGANMIHTIRTIMNNDSTFRQMLRQMNKTFYHQTVDTRQIEQFIQRYCSFNCTPIFDQYLRQTRIPVLQYQLRQGQLMARFTNCLPHFAMPVWLPTADGKGQWKTVNTEGWTTVATTLSTDAISKAWNTNLYISYQPL